MGTWKEQFINNSNLKSDVVIRYPGWVKISEREGNFINLS